MTKKGATKEAAAEGDEEKKQSNHVQRKLEERKKGGFFPSVSQMRLSPLLWTDAKIDPLLESQFAAGRLYAAISSRPGQSGRADGYILEGKELEFYLRKIRTGKQKHAHA